MTLHVIDWIPVGDAEWFALLDRMALENDVNITIAAINELPYEVAEELAEQFDPDGRYSMAGFGPYGILRENWPENRPEIEDALSLELELENPND